LPEWQLFQSVDALFTDHIDWPSLNTHWRDLPRMVLLIRVGKISSATSLRYLSEPELRQQISEMADNVEAYHGFAGWLFLGWEGVIANNAIERE
jgi:TnpA family transposase